MARKMQPPVCMIRGKAETRKLTGDLDVFHSILPGETVSERSAVVEHSEYQIEFSAVRVLERDSSFIIFVDSFEDLTATVAYIIGSL